MSDVPIDRLLPLRQVIDITGFGKTTIYRLIGDRSFPAPYKAGASSRWSEAEVRAWRESLRKDQAA